ncbi:hypothetical protein Q1695_005713 [Nippostrongylus brasiliensis]|nr:hypothetical protein Q1695_005713 [Nippostrongylus brasiliensis]
MPQKPVIITTKSPKAEVFVFDYTKHSSMHKDNQCKSQLRLRGHTKEGYGLSWNPNRQGYILSASDDLTVCLWDVQANQISSLYLDAKTIFRGHTGGCGRLACTSWIGVRICWRRPQVDDLGHPRQPTCAHRGSHSAEVNCLSFNPYSDFILATGSADKTVAL